MASGKKYIQQTARNLFAISLQPEGLSAGHVAGVLAYLEKHRPPQTLPILKAYHRLVAAEVARGRAIVEHAGPLGESLLQEIARSMSQKYGRPIASEARRNDRLLAGLRVRVGDDLYEQSVASQLAALSASV
jgi:F-type H+-transporting ATPase subunit delta